MRFRGQMLSLAPRNDNPVILLVEKRCAPADSVVEHSTAARKDSFVRRLTLLAWRHIAGLESTAASSISFGRLLGDQLQATV